MKMWMSPLLWIKYTRSQNAPISWNVLKEKSLVLWSQVSLQAMARYSDLIQDITYSLKIM